MAAGCTLWHTIMQSRRFEPLGRADQRRHPDKSAFHNQRCFWLRRFHTHGVSGPQRRITRGAYQVFSGAGTICHGASLARFAKASSAGRRQRHHRTSNRKPVGSEAVVEEQWLIGWGAAAEVLEPSELRQAVFDECKGALSRMRI
jgi:hypothetical protein